MLRIAWAKRSRRSEAERTGRMQGGGREKAGRRQGDGREKAGRRQGDRREKAGQGQCVRSAAMGCPRLGCARTNAPGGTVEVGTGTSAAILQYPPAHFYRYRPLP